MKLSERLKISQKFLDFRGMESGLEAVRQLPPKWTDYDRAWSKFNIPHRRFLISLSCYYSDDHALAASHAAKCIAESDEFFFGSWRSEYITPENTVDVKYWKREFDWMEIFEAALLWGSVLNEWEYLKKCGTFPEPDSCFSGDYKLQDRDLYVALGGFLREAPRAELSILLERVSTGSKKHCKLLVAVIHSCFARDAALFQKTLIEFLKHYKKSEFPKEYITKKISIEGTLFVHWAEKEKLPITLPTEFEDYIVRLK